MNIKIKSIFLMVLIGLGGCGTKEEKVKKSIAYLNQFTNQLLAKVNAKSNLSEGIKDAQVYLSSKKTTAMQHVGITKKTSRAQVSEETMKTWQSAIVINLKRMEELKITHVNKALNDKGLANALNKLVKDYRDLLQK